MNAYIFDTETTGFTEPEIIQAASRLVTSRGEFGLSASQFFKPSKPIELGAKATHHILESDLTDCPPSSEFKFSDFVSTPWVIGHNIDYDWEVAGRPEVKRICTLALARSFWPQLDSHSQSALMYFTFGDEARDLVKEAHDAGQDVWNLSLLWQSLFLPKITQLIGLHPSWEQVWELSEKCRIPTVMGFGKHKGVAIKDVPPDYMLWYLRQPEVDPYYEKAFCAVLGTKIGRRK